MKIGVSDSGWLAGSWIVVQPHMCSILLGGVTFMYEVAHEGLGNLYLHTGIRHVFQIIWGAWNMTKTLSVIRTVVTKAIVHFL
ncbi:hypothetical protein DSUL_50308 [Desulfovibrionales bacterium]